MSVSSVQTCVSQTQTDKGSAGTVLGATRQWQGEPGQQVDQAVMAQLRRYLAPQHPRLRVWGAQRFDCQGPVAPHWAAFGSYLYLLPL